jgi:hypothetical protein
MSAMSLAEFAAETVALALAVHEESKSALERAARLVEKEAKTEIGTYQSSAGPFPGWQQLADSTQTNRAQAGFPPNDPLLITGSMRDSIEHTVDMDDLDGVAYVGSNNPIALWQEQGTTKIPPRSFLGGALFRKETEVRDLIGGSIYGALIGKPDAARNISGVTDVIGQEDS